jgi:division protein CdvB (Snf7/Vps24/ESCRT-III family)
VNKVVDPAQVMRTMNQFSTEVDKMEVAQESWDDLMDLFDGEGVEAEADNVVDGVLDELGICMGQQLDAAGVVPQSHVSSEADRLLSELGISSPPTVYKLAGNPAANPAL